VRTASLVKRFGAIGFAFFALKGLAWLAIFAAAGMGMMR
jgi:hypothetical protein